MLPVTGALLALAAGLAQTRILMVRVLALREMVGIGLISYSWYLWHWPILSFIRISRLGETSLPIDFLGGAVLAFFLALLSYRFIERPVREWRRSVGRIKRPGRIVAVGVAATLVTVVIGGLSSVAGYFAIMSMAEGRYGADGKGITDNGCRILTSSVVPAQCLVGKLGMLVGDSHADALFPTFARRFAQNGIRLVSIARGGCNPVRFAPSMRADNRMHECSNLVKPFEQLLARPTQLNSVVIDSAWGEQNLTTLRRLVELVGQFDRSRTRVLLIGPVPIFKTSSLACVVLMDRYGESRHRCDVPRSVAENNRASIVKMLKATVTRFGNVRYVDPLELFCDATTCRPYQGNRVFYWDQGHVDPAGADRIFDNFMADFHWLFGAGMSESVGNSDSDSYLDRASRRR